MFWTVDKTNANIITLDNTNVMKYLTVNVNTPIAINQPFIMGADATPVYSIKTFVNVI